jgi:release factor glutamine methyltransferase
MPVSGMSAPHTFSTIVSALRGAGCVFAEDEAGLLVSEAPGPTALADWVGRRTSGEPLEYILGWADFDGHRVAVKPRVFVPRRRTQLLVDEAVGLLQGGRLTSPRIVVDLCCGSGAVGAAIARRDPGAELHAADIDPEAVKCARGNVGAVGGHVYEGDLFAALPPGLRGRVHVLAVNAPYVPSDAIQTMPPEARLYESRTALDGGTDGLDFHRRVAAAALDWLSSDGQLLIETSEQQAEGTASIVAAAGLAVRIVHSDDLDGTVVIGTAGVGTAGVGTAVASNAETVPELAFLKPGSVQGGCAPGALIPGALPGAGAV